MKTWDTQPSRESEDILFTTPSLVASLANTALRGGIEDTFPRAVYDELPTLGANLAEIPPEGDFLSVEEVAGLVRRAAQSEAYILSDVYQIVREGDVATALSRRVAIFNRLTGNDDSVAPVELRLNPTNLEASREGFAEVLSDTMLRPESRANLSRRAGVMAGNRSERLRKSLKDGETIIYDVVAEGGGYHMANYLATLQETCPEARVLVIDDGDRSSLGGQFAKYGRRPSYHMNSSYRAVSSITDVYGIPKRGGNLNTFGLHAPIQMADYVGSDKPTNIDAADGVGVVMMLSDPDVLFIQKGGYRIRDSDRRGFDEITVPGLPGRVLVRQNPELKVYANGIGIPDDATSSSSRIRTPASIWQSFGTYVPGSGPHPASQFSGQKLVVYGCGDTGKGTLQLPLGQGPLAAYERWARQRGLPREIVWAALELGELGLKGAFKGGTRVAYSGIARYLPEKPGDPSLIRPVAARAVTDSRGNVVLRDKDGALMEVITDADIIIPAVGPRDPAEVVTNFAVLALRQADLVFDRFGAPYGRVGGLLRGSSIGPVVPIRSRGNAGVPENSAAVFQYAPGDTLAGYATGRVVRRIRGL